MLEVDSRTPNRQYGNANMFLEVLVAFFGVLSEIHSPIQWILTNGKFNIQIIIFWQLLRLVSDYDLAMMYSRSTELRRWLVVIKMQV